jgi:SAM-dependent methyltransferase
VLELAAGPGDTGFLAAELIKPGGTLISSDGAELMVELAKARAAELGIDDVEFMQLELEWIDLETASVDAALCRWGVMLCVDPEAAVREIRRVVRPGGRFTAAVWDLPERNPWVTVPSRALIKLGHATPPPPGEPGIFALSGPGELQELVETAGFVEVRVEPVAVSRPYGSLAEFIDETRDLSMMFRQATEPLSAEQLDAVEREIATLAEPFTEPDGSINLPGSSLVCSASA